MSNILNQSIFFTFEYIIIVFAAPTNLSLVILSGASLEVNWEPAPDADLSLTYTVTADSVSMETKHANSTLGDSSVTLSSLQELTVYNVSVQAVNSGGPSRSLIAAVRMVTVGQLGRTGVQTAFAVLSVERLFQVYIVFSSTDYYYY